MSRFRMLLAEAARSARASLSTTFAATMTVLVGMVLLGVAIALGTFVASWRNSVEKELVVKVFFCTQASDPDETPCAGKDARPEQINAVRARLEADPRVRRVEFVSKETGFERLRRQHPELVESAISNPLPDAEHVIPTRPDFVDEIAASLEPLPAGVEKVDYGEELTSPILRWGRIVYFFVVGLIIALLVASTLLISTTIRLSIFARRREIEVMKLVGASNWFVRGPFILEGVFCGLLGSLLAVFILLVGNVGVGAIFDDVDSRPDVHALGFAWIAAILVMTGLVIAAAGSGLSLRRFLRV